MEEEKVRSRSYYYTTLDEDTAPIDSNTALDSTPLTSHSPVAEHKEVGVRSHFSHLDTLHRKLLLIVCSSHLSVRGRRILSSHWILLQVVSTTKW